MAENSVTGKGKIGKQNCLIIRSIVCDNSRNEPINTRSRENFGISK